jgi:hypothetical protein
MANLISKEELKAFARQTCGKGKFESTFFTRGGPDGVKMIKKEY